MSYNAVVLPVMIASPSDVADERAAARDVINLWNYAHSETRRAVLMPVGWETHSAPELGKFSAQDLINSRVLKACDLLVGIFWTRIGTRTADAASGSAEEIERHLASGKPALVYFSDRMMAPAMLNQEQWNELQQFRAWCSTRGLVETFESIESFRAKFSHQLNITMNQNPFVADLLDTASEISDSSWQRVSLTVEATRLLRAAVEDGSGELVLMAHLGGEHIAAGRQSFGDNSSPRDMAKWRHGFDELVRYELIEDVGYKGEIFRVTELGWRTVEEAEDKATQAVSQAEAVES